MGRLCRLEPGLYRRFLPLRKRQRRRESCVVGSLNDLVFRFRRLFGRRPARATAPGRCFRSRSRTASGVDESSVPPRHERQACAQMKRSGIQNEREMTSAARTSRVSMPRSTPFRGGHLSRRWELRAGSPGHARCGSRRELAPHRLCRANGGCRRPRHL